MSLVDAIPPEILQIIGYSFLNFYPNEKINKSNFFQKQRTKLTMDDQALRHMYIFSLDFSPLSD